MKDLGLNAEELPSELLQSVWKIHRINNQRNQLVKEQQKKEMEKKMKEIPPDILNDILRNQSTPTNNKS